MQMLCNMITLNQCPGSAVIRTRGSDSNGVFAIIRRRLQAGRGNQDRWRTRQVFQQYHQMVSSNHSVHSDRQPVGEWLHRKLQGKAPRTAVKRRELRHLGFTGLYLDTQSNQSSDALEVNDTTTFSGSPHETGKIPCREAVENVTGGGFEGGVRSNIDRPTVG